MSTRTIPSGWTDCPRGCGYFLAECPKCGHAKPSLESLAQTFDDAVAVTDERQLQNDALAWLRYNGAKAIVWHAMNKKTTCGEGVADFVFLWRGRFVAAEAKVGNRQPTEAQAAFLREAIDGGGIAFVFRSVGELHARLSEIRP